MFYVSAIDHELDGIKYGITDTRDNVTEYYTKKEIKAILDKVGYTSIRGVVYTGSDLKFRITTPVIEYISDLPNGTTFKLDDCTYKRLCELSGDLGWHVEKDGVKCKLLKQTLKIIKT